MVHKLLDLMFNNSAYGKPDTYIALATATVGDTDTGSTITEPSGNNYSRKQVNINGGASPAWALAASGRAQQRSGHHVCHAERFVGHLVAACVCSASTGGT